MHDRTLKPREPVTIEVGEDPFAIAGHGKSSLPLRFLRWDLRGGGAFLIPVGSLPLFWLTRWALGRGTHIQPLLAVVTTLYRGSGLALFAWGVLLQSGRRQPAIFSSAVAVAIPVTLFSLLGF
jgi:hypothetical protein